MVAGTAAEFLKKKQILSWESVRQAGFGPDQVRLSFSYTTALPDRPRRPSDSSVQSIVERVFITQEPGFLPFRTKITCGKNWEGAMRIPEDLNDKMIDRIMAELDELKLSAGSLNSSPQHRTGGNSGVNFPTSSSSGWARSGRSRWTVASLADLKGKHLRWDFPSNRRPNSRIAPRCGNST